VTTLYDDLGVNPDASAEELRRAYRSRARQLHPDVNAEADDHERMRQLNRAWAVLGNPATREQYDRTLRRTLDRAPTGEATPLVVAPAAPVPWRWMRPSVVAVAVLVIIFIATAYAGPHRRGGPPVTTAASSTVAGAVAPATGSSGTAGATATTATTTTPGTAPSPPRQVDTSRIGQCLLIQPGYDAIVGCLDNNDGLVVGETANTADCGTATRVHQLAGKTWFVCLKSPTP
jgi:hypothetical protein